MKTNTMADIDSSKVALMRVIRAIVQTVNETPEGAPGGILYAVLMSQGCTLNQFETLMSALVMQGIIRKQGDCYYPI